MGASRASALVVAAAIALAAATTALADSVPGGTVGSRLGFNAGWIDWNLANPTTDIDAVMAGIQATGAKWVRFDFAWWDIQPTNDPDTSHWNWVNADRLVNSAIAHGLNIVAVPYSAPCWAAGVSGCVPWDDHYVGANPNDYGTFVTQLGVRYLNRVSTWELWNEPNNPGFYKPNPSPQDYVQKVLIPGATGLRNARAWLTATTGVTYPLRILTGGTAPADTGVFGGQNSYSPGDFLTGIYQYGGQSYFDAVAHHPYSFPYPPETNASWNAFLQTDTLNGIMSSNGDGAKEIWATEVGFPTQLGAPSPNGACPTTGNPALDKCVDENSQAGLADLTIRAWIDRSYTGPMIWFSYRDGPTGVPGEDQYGWGVVKSDFTWKPSRLTMQAEAAFPVASLGPLASIVEGEASTRNLASTITLSTPYANPVTVTCQTFDGSAIHSTDFTAKTTDVVIAKNTTSDFFPVPVKGETAVESDEVYLVGCDAKNSAVTCAEIAAGSRNLQSCTLPAGFPVAPIMKQAAAYGVILNDDPSGATTEVSIGDAWMVEGDVNHTTNKRNLYFTVSSSKVFKDAAGVAQPLTVNVAVSNGTATAGSDFTAPAATVTIAKSATIIKVGVPIIGDAVRESDESFTVTISNPTSGAVIRRATATATIIDDDY